MEKGDKKNQGSIELKQTKIRKKNTNRNDDNLRELEKKLKKYIYKFDTLFYCPLKSLYRSIVLFPFIQNNNKTDRLNDFFFHGYHTELIFY